MSSMDLCVYRITLNRCLWLLLSGCKIRDRALKYSCTILVDAQKKEDELEKIFGQLKKLRALTALIPLQQYFGCREKRI